MMVLCCVVGVAPDTGGLKSPRTDRLASLRPAGWPDRFSFHHRPPEQSKLTGQPEPIHAPSAGLRRGGLFRQRQNRPACRYVNGDLYCVFVSVALVDLVALAVQLGRGLSPRRRLFHTDLEFHL
ncbi:hypothetical protein J6590_040398 [Homalodisca vitripennis]|nr:hypothetical protein J6590_040398 [Homalodisca vitripennis]